MKKGFNHLPALLFNDQSGTSLTDEVPEGCVRIGSPSFLPSSFHFVRTRTGDPITTLSEKYPLPVPSLTGGTTLLRRPATDNKHNDGIYAPVSHLDLQIEGCAIF